MPRARSDGHSLYYETGGSADERVVFLNEVGFGTWQWGWQYAAVEGPFGTLAFDPRGTGRSGAPPGPYDVDSLAADLEAVLADAGVRRAHLVGCGLGGMVALEYAHRYGRARTLSLFATALSGAVVTDALDDLCTDGETALDPCLSRAFRDEQPDVVMGIEQWREAGDAAPGPRAAQAAAMRSFEVTTPHELTVPTLVCHGDDDPVVPCEAGEALAEALPRGAFVGLRGRHLAHVEDSRAANDALVGFLETQTEQ